MAGEHDHTETERIARCQAGERPAFAGLIAPYRKPLFSYLLRLTQNRSQAEDLLQETLVRAWRGLPRYRHRGRFGSWLFSIAYHTTLKALDHQQVREHVIFTDDLPDHAAASPADAALLSQELQHALAAAVQALPEEQRQVFLLRQHSDLSFKEIAALTQTPLSTVLSRMHYAVSKLRNALQAHDAC